MYNKKLHENYKYEFNFLKNLNHQNIIKCTGHSEDQNYFYMDLEYCISGDLSKSLWQNKNSKVLIKFHIQYPEKVVKHMSTQLLQALHYIHKNNIVHCNLKPSNILVDEYGNIRLCDFKKAMKANTTSSEEIRKNKAAMTPCYTAPELFAEDGSFHFKTDLWAMGCIMYELAVGQVPFFDESVGKLIAKVINEDVNFNRKELQNFSDEFVEILRRLLEKDPNNRISWNEIEKHSFWELNISDSLGINEGGNSGLSRQESVKSARSKNGSNVGITNMATEKKKNVDIMRLSRNALQNMIYDREDEYSREKQKEKEVDNADQEFKFEGKDDRKLDDYDSTDKK